MGLTMEVFVLSALIPILIAPIAIGIWIIEIIGEQQLAVILTSPLDKLA